MTNERNSVWIALLANILLLYAWNSCPILEWTYPEASLQLAVNLLFESITQQITLGTNLLPFQHGIILKRSCRLPLSTLWRCPITCPGTSSLSLQIHQLLPPRPTNLLSWQHCVCTMCSLVGRIQGPCWQIKLTLHWTMTHHCFPQRRVIWPCALFDSQSEDKKYALDLSQYHWSLFHSNPLMALIINMVNFTNPLMLNHTKKQESKDLYPPCPSNQLHSYSQLTSFTGWVCLNSTMTYSLSTGHPRRNANNTWMAIWYHHFPHLLHPHTILLWFLPSAALQQPSSGARTSYSSSLIWLAPMRLKNGDLSGLLSRNLYHCIHCAYKMGGFLLNFTSVTLQSLGTMRSINAFGFNTIQTASFSCHSLGWRLILFICPLLW